MMVSWLHCDLRYDDPAHLLDSNVIGRAPQGAFIDISKHLVEVEHPAQITDAKGIDIYFLSADLDPEGSGHTVGCRGRGPMKRGYRGRCQ